MKKIAKASELLWLFGVIFVALGVALCSKADLGVSMIAAPAFVLSDALSFFSVGVIEYIAQGILLLILCIVIRRFRARYLLAFAVAVIYGYTLDLFLLMLSGFNPDTVAMRWVLLLIGDAVTAFGVACFFRTYMPLQVYELFVSELSDRFGFRIERVKWCFDMSLLALSIVLALVLFGGVGSVDFGSLWHSSYHSIGLGTIVTTLINSPIIAIMGKLVDKLFDPTPLLPRLKEIIRPSQRSEG